MNINISKFFTEDAAPRDYSASVAEIGQDAGAITWRHACEDVGYFKFLDTDDKLQAFRDWVKPSGGWTDDEIAAWSPKELNALFLQWVSGDIRECLEWDVEDVWANYQEMAEAGHVSSNLYRADDGQVYFSLEY